MQFFKNILYFLYITAIIIIYIIIKEDVNSAFTNAHRGRKKEFNSFLSVSRNMIHVEKMPSLSLYEKHWSKNVKHKLIIIIQYTLCTHNITVQSCPPDQQDFTRSEVWPRNVLSMLPRLGENGGLALLLLLLLVRLSVASAAE